MRLVAFFLIISMSLPGEAISTSTPAFSAFHCSCLFYPPSTHATFMPYFLEYFLVSTYICWHSSRVGARIIAMGPSPLPDCSWRDTCIIIGHTYAKVLPLPVFAIPTTSLPERAAGRPIAWMGVGFSNWFFTMSRLRVSSMLRWPKLTMGLGTSAPATLISSSFLSRRRTTCTCAPPAPINHWFRGAPRRSFCRSHVATPSKSRRASVPRWSSATACAQDGPATHWKGSIHPMPPTLPARGRIAPTRLHSLRPPVPSGALWRVWRGGCLG